MTREEALEKVGKRLQRNEPLYGDVPVGTTGTVMHANLVHRFANPDYGDADVYELIVAWDVAYSTDSCHPVHRKVATQST